MCSKSRPFAHTCMLCVVGATCKQMERDRSNKRKTDGWKVTGREEGKEWMNGKEQNEVEFGCLFTEIM